MSKGWAVEVTSTCSGPRGPKWRRQLFHVAIENKAAAIEAAIHRARCDTTIDVVATERMAFLLSPGRVKVHPATELQELPGGANPFSSLTIHANANDEENRPLLQDLGAASPPA
jgi:hypothetical protein